MELAFRTIVSLFSLVVFQRKKKKREKERSIYFRFAYTCNIYTYIPSHLINDEMLSYIRKLGLQTHRESHKHINILRKRNWIMNDFISIPFFSLHPLSNEQLMYIYYTSSKTTIHFKIKVGRELKRTPVDGRFVFVILRLRYNKFTRSDSRLSISPEQENSITFSWRLKSVFMRLLYTRSVLGIRWTVLLIFIECMVRDQTIAHTRGKRNWWDFFYIKKKKE